MSEVEFDLRVTRLNNYAIMTQSMVNEGKKKCNELKYSTVLPDIGFPAICISLGCD